MNIKIELDEPNIIRKVTNDRFGLFMAQQWKKQIDPYTPKDTGALMGLIGNTVDIRPFEIQYNAQNDGYYYASDVYYGEDLNFQKKNPYSTDHWDRAAEGAGQKDKLCRILNSALKSGQY